MTLPGEVVQAVLRRGEERRWPLRFATSEEGGENIAVNVVWGVFWLVAIGTLIWVYGTPKGRAWRDATIQHSREQKAQASQRELRASLGKERQRAGAVPPTVRCATCGSDNVARIKFGRKAGAGLMFGVLAAGFAAKTFKCRSCGYTW